jgi:hypothetical protein
MADLTDIQAASSTKIVGSDSTGLEQVPVESVVGSDGKGRLLVDAAVASGQLVPTITNQFRIRLNIGNTLVPAAYTTLFTRSGTGLFFGFQAAFNSANVDIRLTIDGGTVFEINLNDIKQFHFNDTGDTRMQLGGFLTTNGNALDFSSKFAIPYTTAVTIEVKRSDGSNHQNNNWIVFLTED